MTVTKADVSHVTSGKRKVDIFSDADHASDFSRRSTGANASLLQGPEGSRGLIDFGSKVQPSVARSSGESDSTHVGEVAKGLSESPVTAFEHDLIVRASEKTKIAAVVAQRVCFPIQDFVAWMLEGTNLSVAVDTLKVGATVAKAITISGSSKALKIVKKTMAVDLLNLRDTLHALKIKAEHVGSSENVADMWTKAISAQTLVHLNSLIRREAGHAQLFSN